MPWDAEFEYPVPGLLTLRDAANYIMKLPKAEQAKTHWQTAGEMLLIAAEERGPLMFAHIAMLRALDHGKPAPVQPPRRKAAKKYRIAK
jgi:hypothetical protein